MRVLTQEALLQKVKQKDTTRDYKELIKTYNNLLQENSVQNFYNLTEDFDLEEEDYEVFDEDDKSLYYETPHLNIATLHSLLKNEIEARYKIHDEIHSYLAENEILRNISEGFHDFKYLWEHVTNSKAIAYLYGAKYIPIKEQLVRLGIDIKEVKKLLKEVKKHKLSVALIGYGGVNLNFTEYLIELCQATNVHDIFKQMAIYEHDEVEPSNIFRFNTTRVAAMARGSLTSRNYHPTSNQLHISKLELVPDEIQYLSKDTYTYGYYLDAPSDKEAVYIGAPDMLTRKSLEDKNFLCATHKNNTTYLHSRPVVDSLLVESYGKIDLEKFFPAMLKLTIEILRALANNSYPKDTLLYKG